MHQSKMKRNDSGIVKAAFTLNVLSGCSYSLSRNDVNEPDVMNMSRSVFYRAQEESTKVRD